MQIGEPAWINSSCMRPEMAIITGCNLESGDDHPIHITTKYSMSDAIYNIALYVRNDKMFKYPSNQKSVHAS